VLPEFLFTEPMGGVFFDRECRAAGKNGERISLKGAVIDRERFEGMKEEYYQLRGWDPATGLQKEDTLKSLGLPDVVDDLKKGGLALQ
jgi:aldehyde:ferredoxin oxidoreductase